jgi:Ca2+-binding EF-hand superfamily protein
MEKTAYFFLIILSISALVSMSNALDLKKNMNLKSNTKTQTNASTRMISKITATITTKQAEEIQQFLKNTQQFNQETEKIFNHLDSNHNGSLDHNEARKGIHELAQLLQLPAPTDSQFKLLFKSFSNPSGELNLTNFRVATRVVLQFAASLYRNLEQAKALKQVLNDANSFNQLATEAFKKIDTNNDGNLDLQEVTQAVRFVCSHLHVDQPSSEYIQNMYSAVQNQNGKVGLNEFKSGIRFLFQQFIANTKH